MDLNDIMKMLKDPQALQRQAAEAQEKMASIVVCGSAGGGMVKFTMNGAMELLAVEISPELLDSPDKDMLQDLIKAAYNDASSKIRETMQADVAKKFGGSMPGFGL